MLTILKLDFSRVEREKSIKIQESRRRDLETQV